ncbi:MAG TPA: cyclic nucleotide-binding domain-containing protein, partial [Thermoanaerobaculia bacterium]|nr:cyclic nucleotide-binding domain-containing protein [Thermoanaerobaculia bacterium]
MTEPASRVPSITSPVDKTFPTLTPEQVARLSMHGTLRPVRSGEVLVEAGDREVPFFVVATGQLEIVQPSNGAETLVAVHGPGQFT